MNSKNWWVICVLHENQDLPFCFLFAGEPFGGKAAAGIPRGYWSFSWVAEDDLSLVSKSPSGEQDAAAGPLQIDGQAKAPPSFRDLLLLFPPRHVTSTFHQHTRTSLSRSPFIFSAVVVTKLDDSACHDPTNTVTTCSNPPTGHHKRLLRSRKLIGFAKTCYGWRCILDAL